MFKLPKDVVEGLDNFRTTLNRYQAGEVSAARFKGFRVPWGIYSQRKEKSNMVRVRFPAGVANATQLKAIAEASRRFSDSSLHVTDRQDIQIHNASIGKVGEMMDFLKDFELSPRGGGGNTVRNITACPLAGICSDESFDVRSDAIALTEYMLSDEKSYTLPRKYKLAFSGCSRDCAYATVNDLGFIAKTKNINGKEVNGYSIYVGGGLGASSRVGRFFDEFIPQEEVGEVAQAVKMVFFKHGNRDNKHHARMRFLLEDIGMKKFKKLYLQELKTLKRGGGVKLRRVKAAEINSTTDELEPAKDDPEFITFLKHNVSRQSQDGLYVIEVRISLGDINSDDLEKLGSVGDDFGALEYRTSQRQNILLTNVTGEQVYDVYKRLKSFGLARAYASTVVDVVCCAGASTCNLGICDSKAMSLELIKSLEKTLDLEKLELLDGARIKINGCPNSCGHAPIGHIGLTGMTQRIDSRMVPFYKISLGGRVYEGETKLNEPVGLVPAKKVPQAISQFLTETQKNINSSDELIDYLENEGVTLMEEIIESHSYVPTYNEDPSFYRDWGKTDDFSLAGIGSGECGAGVKEIIESDLGDAQANLEEAEKELNQDSIAAALHFSARALLVVRGIDPITPEETFKGFVDEIVEKGFCHPEFKELQEIYNSLGKSLSTQELKEKLTLAKQLYDDVSQAYAQIDNSFNFKKRY